MYRKRKHVAGRSLPGFLALMVLAGVGLWLGRIAMDSVRKPAPPTAARPESPLPILEAKATPAQEKRLHELRLAQQEQQASAPTQGDEARATELTEAQAEQQKQLDRQNSQARLEIEQARLAQALVSAYPDAQRQSSAQDLRRARCQAARDHREAVLMRAGLNRSFDLLRKLDDEVYEACKGV